MQKMDMFISLVFYVCINEIEAETVKDIFMKYLFGVPINDICKKLANYQSKPPKGLSQWNSEMVRDILND